MGIQFSPQINEIIEFSRQEARRLGASRIRTEHLLLAILRDEKGRAATALRRLGADTSKMIKDVSRASTSMKRQENATEATPSSSLGETPTLSTETVRTLRISVLEGRQDEKEPAQVGAEHVLLAILREDDGLAADILRDNHITYSNFLHELIAPADRPTAGMGYTDDDDDDDEDMPRSPKGGRSQNTPSSGQTSQATQKKPSDATPVLDNFSTDITRAAAEGKLDPVVGREKEIERVAQILTRRKKNNPILIGEPGVGKSAIVEGLALRICQKKVSPMLFNKRVVALDMASVVAGTKYRGQFEERMRALIVELQKNPDVVLFIDEIHTIVGAGAAAGSMDAANMLKPALARGEVQCIGATTNDEYRKSIEKDGALERRFQKVSVEPATEEESLQILRNIKDRYEDHHNVAYTDEALQACVSLTSRYITDRYLPDKAIDALDEAGARMHLLGVEMPKEIEDLEKRLSEASQLKTSAVKSQDFELAANYRDREKELEEMLNVMKADWAAHLKENPQQIDEQQIAEVVAMMSGIPVGRMAQAESARLAHLKEDLQTKVIGQDDAVARLSKAILRSRIGLKAPDRPIGSFLFLGPTGVGKTLLAKQLAVSLFGSEDALIRVDMSEYMDKFNVSRLVGAPPGYVGYDEGGQLTERVRRKPYAIVLLDEIEKAHTDVFNILLQVMDEGRLTDSYGRTVDFRNTVVIMTSNVGSRQLKDFGVGIGFTGQNRADDKEYARSVVRKALEKRFAPEFLNRIDEIITFDALGHEAIARIVDIEIEALAQRVEKIGYRLLANAETRDFIGRKGYNTQFGARPLKRAIQTYIEDPLAEYISGKQPAPGSKLVLHLDEKGEQLTIESE